MFSIVCQCSNQRRSSPSADNLLLASLLSVCESNDEATHRRGSIDIAMRFTKTSLSNPLRFEAGGVRTALLLITALILGLGLSVLIRSPQKRSSQSGAAPGRSGLSAESTAILEGLQRPIELRFYSILDPASVPASLQEYARRVDALLTEYERVAQGKITIRRFGSEADADAEAAAADGLRAFNRDKGRACYLGISVGANAQKEVLSALTPAWESALEADISRVVERAAAKPSGHTAPKVASPPLDPGLEQSVRKLFPDLDSISLEEANRRLRQSALEEFAQTVNQMAPAIKAAEQRVHNSKTSAEGELARQALQQLQAQQASKLQELAAKSESQVKAVQQLKSAP